jgi:beta-lactamase regulating signal transducer with metallopeptidase domain/uncharacterized small protein (DUF1192 family)
VDAPLAAAPAPGPAALPFAWAEVLPVVWVLGSAGWFLLASRRVRHFQQLLRLARPAPPPLRNRVERLARRLGLAECPGVWLIPGRVAPMLWAFGGPPRLLVPAELLRQVGPDQLDTLLIHELAHLRRHDHWVRPLEFLALGLYWWHPVAWLARRQLREAEEQCCDAWVLSLLPGAGRAYATALVETLDFLSEARPVLPLLASGLGPVTDLKRRLTMIMRGTTPRSLGWGSTLALFGLGALLLPALPTWARGEQQDEQRAIQVRVTTTDELPVIALGGLIVNVEDEDVKKLQDEIARLKADLAKKMADLHAAEAKMKAGAKKEEKEKRVIRIEKGPGEGKKEGVIHIEIVGGNINLEQLKEMLKGLEKSMPGNIRFEFGPGQPPKPRPDQPKQPPVPAKPGTPPMPPTGPGPGGFPPGPMGGGLGAPGAGFGAGFGGGGGFGVRQPGVDPRLEKLEKQLGEVLKELESLRKELKAPQRREERRPGTGTGAAGQGVEEARELEARKAVAERNEARVLEARKALEERLLHLRTAEAKAADVAKLATVKQNAVEAATAALAKHQDQLKEAEAKLKAAQADLEKLKAEKGRIEGLFEQGSVAREQVEKAQAEYVKALDQIKQLTDVSQRVRRALTEQRDRATAERDLLKEAQKSRQELEKEMARLKAQLAELEAKLKERR